MVVFEKAGESGRGVGPLTQSVGGLVLLVCSSQLGHQVGAVVAGVVGDDGWQLQREEEGEGVNGKVQRFNQEVKTTEKKEAWPGRTIMSALAKDSMATASFPGVLLARSDTTLAISISEQPEWGGGTARSHSAQGRGCVCV